MVILETNNYAISVDSQTSKIFCDLLNEGIVNIYNNCAEAFFN